LKHLLAVASQFASQGQVLEVREYGRGNVNDTFLVTVGHLPPPVSPEVPGAARFILQRLNTKVFRQPELVMGNLGAMTEHVDRRLPELPLRPGRRFEVPRVLLAPDGRDHVLDGAGSFWRALSFIEHAETLDIIKNEHHGREVGYALGLFHQLLIDLPAERLADTLPGFHLTPGYLRHFDEVLAARGAPTSAEVAYCLGMVTELRDWAPVLEEAKKQGTLRLCPIHGDPKVNNVMLDVATGEAVALVDLDTVKPGLVHYDIGDCLRSGCNPLGEETEAWEEVRFEPDLARAILAGYLPRARDVLTENDYAYLYDAIRLLTFELGLRFLADYLAGNVYFKARHREHNLARALVQFKLCDSIESQATAIRTLIRDLR
jgi:Ser/Thr protein kinase RdoA (MazF antagonist)